MYNLNSNSRAIISRELNKETVMLGLFAVMLFMWSCAAFLEDTTLNTGLLNRIRQVVFYLFLAIFLLFILTDGNKYFAMKNLQLCLAPLIYWYVYYFDRFVSPNVNFVNMMFMCIFLLFKSNEKTKIFNIYYYMLYIMALVGIFIFVAYMLNINLPHRFVEYYSDYEGSYYVDYKVCYLYINQNNIVRLCGLFNEPGFFGTVLALAICATNGINKKSRKNIVLFFVGCLTLSLAFFVILIVYFSIRNIKNPKFLLVFIITLIFYFFILPSIHTGINAIDTLLQRVQFANGSLNGDNRSSETVNKLVKTIFSSNKFLFGYGTGYVASVAPGSLSVKTYIVDYGVIGTLLIYGTLFIIAIKKCNHSYLAISYMLVFFVSAYQRPHIFSVVYLVLLFGGIEFIKQNYRATGKKEVSKNVNQQRVIGAL